MYVPPRNTITMMGPIVEIRSRRWKFKLTKHPVESSHVGSKLTTSTAFRKRWYIPGKAKSANADYKVIHSRDKGDETQVEEGGVSTEKSYFRVG